jgi:hypothetical protein
MALLERIAREPEIWFIPEPSISPRDELLTNFFFTLRGSPKPECHRIDANRCQTKCDITGAGATLNEAKNVGRVSIILVRSRPVGFPALNHANRIPMA